MMRGKKNVNAQWPLVSMAYIILELHHKIQSGRLGTHPIVPKAAQLKKRKQHTFLRDRNVSRIKYAVFSFLDAFSQLCCRRRKERGAASCDTFKSC